MRTGALLLKMVLPVLVITLVKILEDLFYNPIRKRKVNQSIKEAMNKLNDLEGKIVTKDQLLDFLSFNFLRRYMMMTILKTSQSGFQSIQAFMIMKFFIKKVNLLWKQCMISSFYIRAFMSFRRRSTLFRLRREIQSYLKKTMQQTK